MFDADRPIQKSDQDRLGRSTFSKYLARAILDQVNTESFTIGLYGGSGVGKTSIINLTLEELRYASNNMFDHEKPIILNYSPWSYSGQNSLIYSFFRRLSAEMRNAEFFKDPEKEQIIYLMELYISFFTHKHVPKSLRPKFSWLTRWFRAKKETIGWESGRDLTKVKAELNELLALQSHKLIIFIDNISRLPDKEILQIFQIVKSIGDFTNTIYILACDKEQVVNILHKLLNVNGAEYLEKIIQLPFDIPPISRQDIEAILLDRLQKVIRFAPDDSWDAEYWADIYYSTLKYFFENCRDITRYINTLSFSFMHVREVVNPVDFFAITAIEIFEPNVYNGIRDNKDLFVELFDTVYKFDQEKLSEDKLRIDEILNRAERIPPEMLELLCIRLFPRLREIYQNYHPVPHSENIARKYKRICTYDLFEVYFRLSVSPGYISETELDAILALTKDETGFQLALLRLNQDERILKLLDLLDSLAVHRIPSKNISNVVQAFMDTADLFPPGTNDALHFETPVRIHRIIHQLLNSIEKPSERFEILLNAIQKAINSLYMIVYEVALQSAQHDENEETFVAPEARDFTTKELLVLQQAAIEKVKYWAKIGRLIEHPKLIPILYAWLMWGKPADCKHYVSEVVRTDRGLLAFLQAALKNPIMDAMKNEEMNPNWKKDLKNIESFIPLDTIIPHATLLFEDEYFVKLKEQEQLALLIFLNLVKPNTLKKFGDTPA